MSRFITLGDRMKKYEATFKQKLNPRSISIIRIDGKAFRTFTKGLPRPFEKTLFENMELTMKYLVKNIQGCKIGYYQSDEITLILTDFDSYDTESWFDGSVQKMCSISASMATAFFNNINTVDKLAMFDARVFQVPTVTEAINCLVWRQQDAVRNSIQACARSIYSDGETKNKNQSEMQEMIFAKSNEFKEQMIKCGWSNDIDLNKENFNWNDIPEKTKRGVTVYYNSDLGYLSNPLDYKTDSAKAIVRDILPILDDYYE